jgi:hypothetical protein
MNIPFARLIPYLPFFLRRSDLRNNPLSAISNQTLIDAPKLTDL